MDDLVSIVCRASAFSVHAYFHAVGLMTAEYSDMCKTWHVSAIDREGEDEADGKSFTDVYITFGVFLDCAGKGICDGKCDCIESADFCLSFGDRDIALAVLAYLQDEDTWWNYNI